MNNPDRGKVLFDAEQEVFPDDDGRPFGPWDVQSPHMKADYGKVVDLVLKKTRPCSSCGGRGVVPQIRPLGTSGKLLVGEGMCVSCEGQGVVVDG